MEPAGRAPDGTPLPPWRLLGAWLLLLLIPVLSVVFLSTDLPDPSTHVAELVALGVLVLVRVAWTARTGRRLLPVLDMPIVGLVFILSGGAASPLDPALFFVYALLAYHLQRSIAGAVRTWVPFLVGVVVMYGLLVLDVHTSQEDELAAARGRLAQDIVEAKEPFGSPMFQRSEVSAMFDLVAREVAADRARYAVLAAHPYFSPAPGAAGATLAGGFETYMQALERQVALLRATVPRLEPTLDYRAASALGAQLGDGFRETCAQVDGVKTALRGALEDLIRAGEPEGERLAQRYEQIILGDLFGTLRVFQENLRAVQEGVDDAFAGVLDLARRRYQLQRDLRRLVSERLAMAILVLATLSLVAGLRHEFEREVERRESARATVELAAKERETENWIALTAGLTHTIGNDILAYDAYGQEALDALQDHRTGLPPEVERNLRFIHDSNKARLGFVKFLDEFARSRKRTDDGRRVRPSGLAAVPLEPLLHEARRRVGELEVADLPRDGTDPQVEAQRRKFVELPLEVSFAAADARVLRRGKRGVLQFFCYELIKNALRYGSGQVPLRVEVEKRDDRVLLRFLNELAPAPISGSEEVATDDEAQRLRAERMLAHCFEPGRGGGTGLGLFLIRYFAREYYGGAVRARIRDWRQRQVEFELELPDDLEEAFARTDGEQARGPVL